MSVFKEHIHWKLLILLSLVLLGLSFTLTLQHVFSYKVLLEETFDEQKSLLKDNMVLRAKNHTESLAIQLENELAAYNFSKFAELVMNDAAKSENIAHIVVHDTHGNVIVKSHSFIPDNHSMLVLKKNLNLGTQPWGIVTLYFTQAELEKKILDYSMQMEEKINYSVYTALFSMSLFFLLFLPIVYSMALHISNPIIDLTKRAEELSKGNFIPKSGDAENRKDELGKLERTFNKMSENLQLSHTKLAEYNAQLENMVQIRTLELEAKNIELEKLSVTDRLTQLYNRVKLEEVFAEQMLVAKRYNTPFSILICDLDFFKSVNDTFGHLIGDQVLIELSGILKATIRDTDVVGRWGGEEFLIICRETDKENAILLAQRLRKAVEAYTFISNQPQTLSIGVSTFISKDSDVSMMGRADSALYSAKDSGRNCVIFSPNP